MQSLALVAVLLAGLLGPSRQQLDVVVDVSGGVSQSALSSQLQALGTKNTAFSGSRATQESVLDTGSVDTLHSCVVGRYWNETLSACAVCVHGMFKNATGPGLCSVCPAGTYSGAGAADCTPCARDSIAPEPGSVECKGCPPKMTNNANSTMCKCRLGYTLDPGTVDQCTACPSGTYMPGHMSTCERCMAPPAARRR